MSKGFFEGAPFHLIMIFAVLATFVLSLVSFINVYQLKKFVIPEPLDIEDFLKKLNAHPEMKGFENTKPLNVLQITANNLQSLQVQIKNLDVSFLGSFLVQYQDRVVVFDYLNDTIKGVVSLQPQLPPDFFTKLNKHAEMRNLKDQQPLNGGVIDEQTLAALKQQSTEYKNAKVGDYVLVYRDTIIVYDYTRDKIVASIKAPAQVQGTNPNQ